MERNTIIEEELLVSSEKKKKTAKEKAVRKTLKGTGHLANFLPTGSVLAFQILSPAITQQGHCKTSFSRSITLSLIALCSLSCFVLCFTDSFRDSRGKVRYGIATLSGLWIIDGSHEFSEEESSRFRLSVIDFLHAIASMLVFVAIAAFDKNVVTCLLPSPSEEEKQMLLVLPIGIGILSSLFFLAFPSKRHGIGFPLSRN